MVRFAHMRLPNATALLQRAAQDAHPRVRLEAIVAASWVDRPEAAKVVFEAMKQPLDHWMGPVTRQILTHTLKDDVAVLQASAALEGEGDAVARTYVSGGFKFPEPPKNEAQKNYGPTRTLEGEDLRMYRIGKEVYLRDAHCATCHQPNGEGLANTYPTLAKSEWLDDEERLIKLTLHGLWGPIEVNGQKFDPSQGVPPMTAFGGLLNDIEMAAVLSYVRQSFGNNGEPVSAESVRKVRDATRDRVNFYMADELLKEHPLPAPKPASDGTAAPRP